MGACYWTFCHCPDNQPCTEHTGFYCSTFNGVTVDGPRRVNDTVTRDAEIAIVALGDDADKIDRLRTEFETKKRDLERMKEEIESGLNNPGGFAARRATAGRIWDARKRLMELDKEIAQALADLGTINSRITAVGGLVGTYLIVPYSSPTGYCECYQEKLRRLAPIASAAGAVRTNELNPAIALRNAASSQVFGWLSPVAFTNIGRIIGTLTLVGACAAFVLLGIKAAVFVLLIGVLATAIYLLTLIIMMLVADARIARARQRIVQLDLQYYRLQNISTCQRALSPPPAGSGAAPLPPGVVDENAWWRELTETPKPGD